MNLPVASSGNVPVTMASTSNSTRASLVSNPFFADGNAPADEPMVCTPDGKCGPASQMAASEYSQVASSVPAQTFAQQLPQQQAAQQQQPVQQPVQQQVTQATLQAAQGQLASSPTGNAFPPRRRLQP